ncbi:MAG: hypothetical protein IV104_17745 [Acidovorax sp.]|nr:hypothetical protein [Acidovorax sp.]
MGAIVPWDVGGAGYGVGIVCYKNNSYKSMMVARKGLFFLKYQVEYTR